MELMSAPHRMHSSVGGHYAYMHALVCQYTIKHTPLMGFLVPIPSASLHNGSATPQPCPYPSSLHPPYHPAACTPSAPGSHRLLMD